jgi:hypothetical protein
MDRLIDNKSDLKKSLEEYFKRVEAIQKLPEYAEFLKYREECEQFAEFINNKRIEKTYEFIQSIIKDDMKVKGWLERIKNLEKELSDSAWKRHESFCSSNIMDHVWEVAEKHGTPADAEEMFDVGAFTLGKFTITKYSGQGEYGYAIYVNKRIF